MHRCNAGFCITAARNTSLREPRYISFRHLLDGAAPTRYPATLGPPKTPAAPFLNGSLRGASLSLLADIAPGSAGCAQWGNPGSIRDYLTRSHNQRAFQTQSCGKSNITFSVSGFRSYR